MNDKVSTHYGSGGDLADRIAGSLRSQGRDLADLQPSDLSYIDEFHLLGRRATLRLAAQLQLTAHSRVVDIGSGLGGAARTLAAEYGCHVTGIDLTPAYCEVAGVMSNWVGLAARTSFQLGDATRMPFAGQQFDAAISLHAAMNIAARDRLYDEARRVLVPGSRFAVFDILQGEGGEALYPAPWAREPSISHLVTREAMQQLLSGAGFDILEIHDSTAESLEWLRARSAGARPGGTPPVTSKILFGDDFDWPQMVRNQLRGLEERRIRTVSFVCVA
ncbi:MAG TPA: class I SAM-dependent methyltransferase [Gammaproteobacteria bacterium]